MEKIVKLIKVLAVEAIDSQKPCTVMFGKAESEDDVVIENKLRLSRKHLCFMNDINFCKGDRVVLLREHGGQRFLVLGVLER